MSTETRHVYEFNEFVLDLDRHCLLREGQVVALPTRAFDMLVALVEANGRILTKDALLEMVWEGAFVEESNLTVAVSSLRRALGDSSSEPVYIETIPRKGYRFAAEVREVRNVDRLAASPDGNVTVEQHTSVHVHDPGLASAAAAPPHKRTWSPVALAAAGIAIVLAVAGAAYSNRALFGEQQSPGVEARIAYERGRYLWKKRTGAGLSKSVEQFRRAIELDPNYADAYAGLAAAYVFDLSDWPKAEATANTALALDPRLAEPHAVIGFGRMFHKWDWAGAEQSFAAAFVADPNSISADQWSAAWLAAHGRLEEAKLRLQTASRLDPTNPSLLADLAELACFEHDYDRAAVLATAAIELEPDIPSGHAALVNARFFKGSDEEYLDARLGYERAIGRPPEALDAIRSTYASGGKLGVIREDLRIQLENPISQAYGIARNYKLLDDHESAMEWLERAVDEHAFGLVYLKVDPAFDDLRRRERFQAVERRVGLN